MKSIETKTLGTKFSIQQPVTLAEALAMGANEERIVVAGFQQELYHVYLGDIRDAVVEEMEKSTGVLRKTEPTTKKDGSAGKDKVTETEQDYLTRLVVDEKVITQSDIDRAVKAALEFTPFKFSATGERKPKKDAIVELAKAQVATALKGGKTLEDIAKKRKCEATEEAVVAAQAEFLRNQNL